MAIDWSQGKWEAPAHISRSWTTRTKAVLLAKDEPHGRTWSKSRPEVKSRKKWWIFWNWSLFVLKTVRFGCVPYVEKVYDAHVIIEMFQLLDSCWSSHIFSRRIDFCVSWFRTRSVPLQHEARAKRPEFESRRCLYLWHKGSDQILCESIEGSSAQPYLV